MNLFKTDIESGALFSEDKLHRLSLWRIWDRSLPLVMLIGLNPSTANEYKTDPTITRIIAFVKNWGYGGFYMMNLFTYVTPNPSMLRHQHDNEANDKLMLEISKECEKVIFCWGSFTVFERDGTVKQLFPDAYCLGVNANGSPKHPLYLSSNTKLIKYNACA